MPERFLHRDPRVLHQTGLAQVVDDWAEQRGGHLQVVQRPAVRGDPLGEPAVERVVSDVIRKIGQPAR